MPRKKKETAAAAPTSIRSRIKELRDIPKARIVPDAGNFRKHPEGQKTALAAALEEIGFAGALLVRPLSRGNYALIDGHERLEHFADGDTIPCLVTDLDADEAKKVLATFDAIGDLAEIDAGKLEELKASVTFTHSELNDLVSSALASVQPVLDAAKADEKKPVEIPPSGSEEPTEAAAAASKADDPGPPENGAAVVVTCRDKKERKKLVVRLRKLGYHCKTTD